MIYGLHLHVIFTMSVDGTLFPLSRNSQDFFCKFQKYNFSDKDHYISCICELPFLLSFSSVKLISLVFNYIKNRLDIISYKSYN